MIRFPSSNLRSRVPRRAPTWRHGSPSSSTPERATRSSSARSTTTLPALARQRPHPLVWINPADAAARGISSGDAVDVVSPRGRVRYEAFVTLDIMAGAVEADAHGGSPGAPEAWRMNANELTDSENRDPISGFPVYKALLCDVVKALQGAAAL